MAFMPLKEGKCNCTPTLVLPKSLIYCFVRIIKSCDTFDTIVYVFLSPKYKEMCTSILYRKIESGQSIRLTGSKEGVHAGFLEIIPYPGGQWQLVCNDDSSWDNQAANVACRQMGYDSGSAEFQIGQNSFADLGKINSQTKVDTLNINCKGDEDNLSKCRYNIRQGNRCDKFRHAVALVCITPPSTLCPSNYVPFKENCYKIVQQPLDFKDAQSYCKDDGNGHLVEIKSQLENEFVSNYALKEYPVVSFWTGGIIGLTNSPADLTLDLWYSSRDPIEYRKFLDEQLRVTQLSGVALDLHNEYYFWKLEDLSLPLPFICQALQIDVGCLSPDKQYTGSASQSKFGEKCLPWNTPGLPQLFAEQKDWNHNYCRNNGGVNEEDDNPICFIDESNYEECDIPLCPLDPRIPKCPEDSKTVSLPGCNAIRYKLENECQVEFEEIYNEAYSAGENTCGYHSNPEPKLQDSCSIDQFQCKPGECIFNKYICDGENDCTNGLDERNCPDYTKDYAIDYGFKLKSDEKSIVNVTVGECAKLCKQSKHSECDSFSYNSNRSRCILGNKSLKAPFDTLLGRKAWNYYR